MAGPVNRQQGFAMLAVGLMALLAVPLYVIIGFLTAPIGLGILMLINDSPWVLKLYPFMFAGTLSGRTPTYYLNDRVGIVLTVLQWAVIAWLFARRVDATWTRGTMLRNAAAMMVLFAIATAVLLNLFGLQVVWEGART